MKADRLIKFVYCKKTYEINAEVVGGCWNQIKRSEMMDIHTILAILSYYDRTGNALVEESYGIWTIHF